ncbi:hypothetical protein BS47DRAFT_1365437 [Hydnum rufescens UP504]|uniref:Uncharacterized protein n=1 Tax=Hydnum rufescens UP504 TaxID=1448309 RepID=A0A9P6ANQ7_9AGAM|nr:hypothetical protein BS47DRAFT_1365437 [Hydnum rufescens UP504]
MRSHPSPKGPPPETRIDEPVYHTPTSAGVPPPRENPPDEHTGEPPVCAATQAERACPPNTAIDETAYHTPAAAGPLPARKPPHNATRSKNPQSQCKKRVPHTRFGGCVVILSLSSGPNTRDPTERTWENNDPPAKRIPRTATSILLNLHPPTEATTPPSENTQPWVRGNPNGEARNDVPGTTHPPKWYHTPARADIIPDKPVWPAASLRFSKSQFRPIFGHFGQFWARR